MAAFDDKPIAPPAVLGNSYANVKTYLGVTAIPQFNLGAIVNPTIDLTRISSQNEIQRVSNLAFNWGAAVVSVCRSDESVGYKLQCPIGFEHIYLQLSVRACSSVTFKFRVESNTTIVYKNDTTSTRQYLDRNVLPVYVGPGEALQLFSDVDAGLASLDYLRVQRVYGLGPLAV